MLRAQTIRTEDQRTGDHEHRGKSMKRRFFVAGAGLAASSLATPFIRPVRAQLQVDRSKLGKTMRFSSYGGSRQGAPAQGAVAPVAKEEGGPKPQGRPRQERE